MAKTIGLTGQTFDRATVLRKSILNHDRRKYVMWDCVCTCGKEFIALGYQLRKNKENHCGCQGLKGRNNRHSDKSERFGRANSRNLLGQYKYGAKKRNLEWGIEFIDFITLTQSPCYYCGIKPYMVMFHKETIGHYVYNGIDRRDSSKGYTTENSVACCKKCNLAKRDMSVDEFLSWASRIVDNIRSQ